MAIWLEHFLQHHPEATYMMTGAKPPANATKKQHKQFTSNISKTYRNRLVSVVFKNAEFKTIYKGNDKRKLGLHSKRKMASTQAKRRGSPAEYVDHRGRWVAKKGNRIVSSVYIDPEDVFADASVAANLCLGGPIKYKLHEAVAGHITTDWLGDNVVPYIAQRYEDDLQMVRTLGLALLFVMLDTEASENLGIDTQWAKQVRDAYASLPAPNKPEQAITRVPLHIYRVGEETFIEEVWQGQQGLDRQAAAAGSTADNLAQIPASGGSTATQQVLQTMLI
jgi:hypothetical protein